MICSAILYYFLILINFQIVYSDQNSGNEDIFFTSEPLYSKCPKLIDSQNLGRPNVVYSYLFYSKINKFYFDVSQENNPSQVTITYWKKSGKVVQILTGVEYCDYIQYDEDNDAIIMLCRGNTAHLFQFQSGQFVFYNEFEHLNTEFATSAQIIKSSQFIKFATICFNESEIRYWQSDQKTSPTKTIQLHIPDNPSNQQVAFSFIFIPNTNFICAFDINKSFLRLFDTNTGEQFVTSNKYIRVLFPTIKKFIQYNNKLNVVVVFHTISSRPVVQQISTFYANNLSLFTRFDIKYDKEYDNRVICMSVIQDTQFVAFGHNDGNITIYNIATTELIRNFKVSENAVLDILINESILTTIALDENKMTLLKQYDWKNNYFVEQRQLNQEQCVSTCDNKQNKMSDWLACRICNPAYKCATCNSKGCVSCNPGLYLDNTLLPSGITQKTCVVYCSQQLFGLISDSSSTQCSEICPSDVYDIENRLCSSSSSSGQSNQFNSISASARLSKQNKEEILVVFDRQVFFNKGHILQTQKAVQQIKQCVLIEINKIKSSDFTYTVNLDPNKNTYLSISINLQQKVGIKDPVVNIKFEGQTCLKDTNYIPLSIDLVNKGLSIDLPWNIINYDENTKEASEKVGKAAQGAGDTVAAAAFPLYLTNVMYIFWILINVFQLVNFLLYLNVKYPINVVSFFRAFKSFNLSFLGSVGIEFNSETQEYSFMGAEIVDQTPAMPFQRESMTSSFYLNGFRFLQTFLILYLVFYLIRILSRSMKINQRNITEDSSISHKFIAIAQQKIEFTMIIATHQSSMLQFSVAIFLQMMGFSSANALNVFGFIISFFALIYLFFFLKHCYQKVNLHEMIVGSKISDKLKDEKLKQKYEEYKMQYGVLYWNVNFIFYGRRNYHFFMMVKQVFISFIVVFFNKFTFVCIFILIVIHCLNSVFLVLYKPFDKKLIGYLSALNEFCMTIILCLIFYIHVVNESSGSIITEEEIFKVVNTGWVIISFLLLLFLVNIISGIVLEWDSIKEAFKKIKQKIKDLTKSSTIESKDSDEKLGFTSIKHAQFQLFNNEEKSKKQLTSNQSSGSDSDTPDGMIKKQNENIQNFDLSQTNIKQSLISNIGETPTQKVSNKKNISNSNNNNNNKFQNIQLQQQQQQQYDS